MSGDIDMSEVKKQSYDYYEKALCDGTHIAYLIFDENCFVGTGGVSFFQIMPTYHNPSGKRAYIIICIHILIIEERALRIKHWTN